MRTGTVKKLPNERQPGMIRLKDKRTYSFVQEDVESGPGSLKLGQEVDFLDRYLNGEFLAKKIKPVAAAQLEKQKSKKPKSGGSTKPSGNQKTAPGSSDASSGPKNGFVNPYNFVPLAGKVHRDKPVFHEYFINNSGRIVCKLKLKTPFFTPHPERRFRLPENANNSTELPAWITSDDLAKSKWQDMVNKNAEKGHEMLGLLKDEADKPFIHGASLKGAFRSVAEALSNSCMSIIDFQWDLPKSHNDEVRITDVANYYSSRQVRSPRFVGRVTKPATPNSDGIIEVSEEFGNGSKKGKIFFRPPAHIPGANVFGNELSEYTDGDPVIAKPELLTQTITVRGKSRPIKILSIQELRADEEGNLEKDEKRGTIKITDITDKKTSHRFIFWTEKPREVKFSWSAQLAYNRALLGGIKEDRNIKDSKLFLEIDGGTKIGKRSRRHELDPDEEDIVYFNENEQGKVKDMGPVELYRVLYDQSLDSILLREHRDFLTCRKIDELCPACRIFGWVHPAPKDEDQNVAHKGFVHFSTATFGQNQEARTQWVTLKPLGQPHPSCWQFYLNARESGLNGGYNDTQATIRGRKFYWHQPGIAPDGAKDKRKKDQYNSQPPDDQNKTVELLLQGEEAMFTFTVDFENLSDADLGLLLLTLKPNLLGQGNELYHHLGMGKPLGLGSVEVEIDSLSLIDRAERYQDLTCSGEKKLEADKMIDAFVKKALTEQSQQASGANEDRQRFADMKHIKDLLLMLDWENAPKEVRYPPGDRNKNTKDYWESFHWFTHKNQKGEKPKNMLLTPSQIHDGKEKQDGFPPRSL